MTRSPGTKGRDTVTPPSLSSAPQKPFAFLAVLNGDRAHGETLAGPQRPRRDKLVPTANCPPQCPGPLIEEERSQPRPVPTQDTLLDASHENQARRRVPVPEYGE